MTSVASQLESLIDEYLPLLNKIAPEDFTYKPSADKWSKKEIVGHLIDSAQNNIRRFIVAQYEDTPEIVYNQDKWVSMNNYQQQPSKDVIQLWYLLNKQVISIMNNLPPEASQKKSMSEDLHTIEWLGHDYIRHMRHHMHVVLGRERVVYP